MPVKQAGKVHDMRPALTAKYSLISLFSYIDNSSTKMLRCMCII